MQVLKSIQSTQAEHSTQFERIEDRLDEINDGMIAALGLATHAQVHDEIMKKDIEDIKRRVKRLESKR